MSTVNITVEAPIQAGIQQVWDMYTGVEHITQWNFANEDWICPSASNDLQQGGKYIARMEARDGSMGFDFEAIYEEVVSPERIRYAMTDGRTAQINFTETDGTTHVQITFDAETQNQPELQQQGWQAILNNFKKYVESKH